MKRAKRNQSITREEGKEEEEEGKEKEEQRE